MANSKIEEVEDEVLSFLTTNGHHLIERLTNVLEKRKFKSPDETALQVLEQMQLNVEGIRDVLRKAVEAEDEQATTVPTSKEEAQKLVNHLCQTAQTEEQLAKLEALVSKKGLDVTDVREAKKARF